CDFYVFIQAEDGIRDGHVTGVQTCALPIFNFLLLTLLTFQKFCKEQSSLSLISTHEVLQHHLSFLTFILITTNCQIDAIRESIRSEERRVGKVCRILW